MKIWAAIAATVLATLSLGANAVGRMVDISIVDRATGRALPVYWHEGRAFVAGNPGTEYKIVARNRRGEELLAVVSVDGLNVLTGETASTDQPGYVVPPRGRTEIKGWRRSLHEIASFYFTSLGDSYAGRTYRPDDVGVIGVAVFQEAASRYDDYDLRHKRKDSKESPGDPKMKKHGGPPVGTGHGEREWSEARPVEFDRDSRYPVETIAIYYDSYRNLVAQGVIPTRYGRRDPDPFPSAPFVPDPPRYYRW